MYVRSDDFRRESWRAIRDSKRLAFAKRSFRDGVAERVLSVWEMLGSAGPKYKDREAFLEAVNQRVRVRLRTVYGFPWLPLALFVAKIIIAILVERWLTK